MSLRSGRPQPLLPGIPVNLCIRPTQVRLVRPERLTARWRENLLSGAIVRETLHAETSTLF
jgi:hypothetical protein